jgi:hypothetical protein
VYAGVWVVIFVMGLPCGTFYFLYARRHELESVKMKQSAGFIYCDYKPEYYWWEPLEMLNKLFLSSILLTFERDSISQVATALIFSVARHVVYAICSPYTLEGALHLQHIVLSCLSMTYFLVSGLQV